MSFWPQVPFNKQFGFQVNNSAGHTLFQLINDIINSFENSESTLDVFIDLSIAFDTVSHDILLTKLDTTTKKVGSGAEVAIGNA